MTSQDTCRSDSSIGLSGRTPTTGLRAKGDPLTPSSLGVILTSVGFRRHPGESQLVIAGSSESGCGLVIAAEPRKRILNHFDRDAHYACQPFAEIDARISQHSLWHNKHPYLE